MILSKPLTLWTIRNKRYGFLGGPGDLGEHSSIYSSMHNATRDLLDYDEPSDWEIVELAEVQQ